MSKEHNRGEDPSTKIIMEMAGDDELIRELLEQFYKDFGYPNLVRLQEYVTSNGKTRNDIWTQYRIASGSKGGGTAALKRWIS